MDEMDFLDGLIALCQTSPRGCNLSIRGVIRRGLGIQS